jgi:hypothetical protein
MRYYIGGALGTRNKKSDSHNQAGGLPPSLPTGKCLKCSTKPRLPLSNPPPATPPPNYIGSLELLTPEQLEEEADKLLFPPRRGRRPNSSRDILVPRRISHRADQEYPAGNREDLLALAVAEYIDPEWPEDDVVIT